MQTFTLPPEVELDFDSPLGFRPTRNTSSEEIDDHLSALIEAIEEAVNS